MQQESVIVFTHDKNNRAERINPQQIRRQASANTPQKPPQEPVPEYIFDPIEERKKQIWDQSHQAIFEALNSTEDRLKKYYNEIIQSDDEFMLKIHVSNLFDDLKIINGEFNDYKKKITLIPQLDDLFYKIREHLYKQDPKITAKFEFLNFVNCTFQIKEEKFEFIKQFTYN